MLLAIAFAGIAIKMIVLKNGEFKRHCSSTDPYTGQGKACICEKSAETMCVERKKHSPLEINDELLKEC